MGPEIKGNSQEEGSIESTDSAYPADPVLAGDILEEIGNLKNRSRFLGADQSSRL